MKLSSLQLKQYFFTRIEVRERPDNGVDHSLSAEFDTNSFDFVGVTIGTNLEVGEVREQQDDPRDFVIRLGIKIENKKGKPAPYDICVEAIGNFTVSEDVPIDRRRDLVVFNGCSILYSAMREIVLIMTSRCAKGGVVLPTVNFVEHIKQNKNIINNTSTPSPT
ncbi:MAG: protein-export chaperone SecB [Nitrosospira multiformis]|nr:protein-export chaperone SecB [Nitrosospira multiformis]